jgi:hypothetical protein
MAYTKMIWVLFLMNAGGEKGSVAFLAAYPTSGACEIAREAEHTQSPVFARCAQVEWKGPN